MIYANVLCKSRLLDAARQSKRPKWVALSISCALISDYCRGNVRQLLPTTQANATDNAAPLPAVIMVEGISHPISAGPLGHYYRYDTRAYAHDDKPSRSCARYTM